jgi:hypothetical protein
MSTAAMTTTNPFEDSFGALNVAATNPFDDNGASSNNPFESDDAAVVALSADEEATSISTPAEASWQYLGDIPYRRVPIYSNIRWNRTAKQETTNDLYRHGLASFPPSVALQHHPSGNSLLNHREVRQLLTTTTITKVAGCPHGGPIATITIPIAGAWVRSELTISTNAGTVLASLPFPPSSLEQRYSPADVLEVGFTSRTALILVLSDSMCVTYNLRGQPILPPFYILPRGESQGTNLLKATVYEGGVAVLGINKASALVELLDDHDEPSYLHGAHVTARVITSSSSDNNLLFGGGQDVTPPHYALVTPLPTAAYAAEHFMSYMTIAVLPRLRTTSKHPEVFLSTNDNSVLVVDAATTEITDVDCRSRMSSPIVDMVFAPNGRFLACFTESSMLTVISASFETKVLDFDTSEGSSKQPLDMKWCGEDSVVLHWKNLGVLMVGPFGDWLRFPYKGTENVYIIPELDCCRIITDSSVELLQRVPPITASLLRIGSIETAAMLLDASDAFTAGSPTCDEAARNIAKTGVLIDAIETCTEAAAREFDIDTQKRLLRAASYGMQFSYKSVEEDIRWVVGGSLEGSEKQSGLLPSMTAVRFVETGRKLRILNALRNPKVGFVLTSAQFDAILPSGVVARLIGMQRPALATAISKYLNLPKSVQLYARASKAAALVEGDTSRSDSEIAEEAIRIINGDPNGDGSSLGGSSINRGGYARVALAASKAGRPGVAKLLLMLETSVPDKVPALIASGSYPDAMAVATTARYVC